MSHVAKIELEINDLETLKAACKDLGFEFLCDQPTYRWYGQWVGDYPLPQGFTQDDLGKCTHAIRVPGATYEIGVVKRGSKYLLLWDFYGAGGLQQHLGSNGGTTQAGVQRPACTSRSGPERLPPAGAKNSTRNHPTHNDTEVKS